MRAPLAGSGLLLCGYAWHFPSTVWNAATLQWDPRFHLVYPTAHLLFTPLCSLADFMTTLSLHQAEALVLWLILLLPLLLGWRRGALALALFVVFVAWGALVPRPMGRLVADEPDVLLIDFHSHTRYSHDGRLSFTPEANRHWHEAQGYEAAFITDHNRVDGSREAEAASEDDWRTSGYRSLEGEEVSLQKTHLVLLGNRDRVDNRPYDGDPRKIQTFVSDMHRRNFVVIASLPEYWLYHWGPGVDDFIRWGMDGFEIVNSAPKALDFPLAKRKWIVDQCNRHHLLMTGITDNHGYGYATAVWNAMRLPGWRTWPPQALEAQIMTRLRNTDRVRFDSVEVLERPRRFSDSAVSLALSPFANLWQYLRELSAAQVVSWLLWIWAAEFIAHGEATRMGKHFAW